MWKQYKRSDTNYREPPDFQKWTWVMDITRLAWQKIHCILVHSKPTRGYINSRFCSLGPPRLQNYSPQSQGCTSRLAWMHVHPRQHLGMGTDTRRTRSKPRCPPYPPRWRKVSPFDGKNTPFERPRCPGLELFSLSPACRQTLKRSKSLRMPDHPRMLMKSRVFSNLVSSMPAWCTTQRMHMHRSPSLWETSPKTALNSFGLPNTRKHTKRSLDHDQ